MKIVQLGANRGSDHVTELVNSSEVEFLLLVEPHPACIPLLQSCYAHVPHIIESVAIVPSTTEIDTVTLYYPDIEDPLSNEVSALNPEHLVRHRVSKDKILSTVVPSITLQKLFSKYNIQSLDYLFIDIEGMEEDILMNFDFGLVDIKVIRAEFIHMKRRSVLETYLQSFGYKPVQFIGYDVVYSK